MSDTYRRFARDYFKKLGELLASLDEGAIADFLKALEQARETGATVFIAGNGGSAATASHMANDLGALVLKQPGSKPLRALALTDNAAFFTAIGNDDGYDLVFVNQLKVHYRPGDLLLVISASGNSPNVVQAAEWVKAQGGRVLGFLGFEGGAALPLCDVAIVARTPRGWYGPVEDAHMILDHLAAAWLQQ